MNFSISDLTAGDYVAWRPLWDGYCRFYEADISEAVTARTWERLIDPQFPLYGRVARLQGRVVGFALHVLHVSTWSIGAVCYLEDLYVSEEVRGTGAGRALIDDLFSLCEQREWGRLYWDTATDNATARKLYERYVAGVEIARYRINL